MKKITYFARYRRNQLRAARRSQKQRARFRTGTVGASLHTAPRKTKVINLQAPPVFSLVENPDETINFFSRLHAAGNKPCRIFVDLGPVQQLTIDALLLLLSKVQRGALARCISVGGNEPKDPKVRDMFAHSGFYDYVSSTRPVKRHSSGAGILKKHVGKRVREDVSAELVHYATQCLHGTVKKNGGLYRALIECMANTKDHARIGAATNEAWWVSAYHDSAAGVVYFAFLDNGVGIFRSAKMQSVLKFMGKFVGLVTHADILNDILDAQLPSRTGLPYRGKGLPAIKRTLGRQDIRNLRIITNDAFLDATTRKGKELKHPFRGTCLTWEIHRA